jgi:hypothetical protein
MAQVTRVPKEPKEYEALSSNPSNAKNKTKQNIVMYSITYF